MSDLYTHYRCTECKAEDTDHQFYTPAPSALVCHKCGAGSKMSVSDQLARSYGMLQLHEREDS